MFHVEHYISILYIINYFPGNNLGYKLKGVLILVDNIKLQKEVDKDILNRIMYLAKKAKEENEVPIGCVIVKDKKIVGEGYNRTEKLNKVLAHAEILAIEEANKALNTWRLEGCDLYTTLEPCDMCWGAIRIARIENVFYLTNSEKNITFKTTKQQIANKALEKANIKLLKTFFKEKRN